MKVAVILLISILFFVISASSQEKVGRPCPENTRLRGGKYQWAGIAPVLGEDRQYFGFVLVKPKDINREHLVRLAQRLRSEYCGAIRLQVVIFDDKKYANSSSLRDYATSKGKIVLMRGFYTFDIRDGTNELEFSTKPGNPTGEVKINPSQVKT